MATTIQNKLKTKNKKFHIHFNPGQSNLLQILLKLCLVDSPSSYLKKNSRLIKMFKIIEELQLTFFIFHPTVKKNLKFLTL